MLGDNLLILKRTFLEFFKERSLMHGAALAFYAMFAMVPILYLTIAYAGRIVGHGKIVEILKIAITQYTGIDDVDGILDFLNGLDLSKSSLFLEIVGLIALLFSASALMLSLRNSLDIFLGIRTQHVSRKKMVLKTLISRGVSLLFVVLVTIIVITVYFTETIILSVSDDFMKDSEVVHWVFSEFSKHGIPLILNLVVFTLIFKYLHSGTIRWKYVFTGSILTSVLLYGGQVFIKFYLGRYFFAAESGIAGALMIILLWVYYSSQIIFFGAKYIRMRALFYGDKIQDD